MRPFGRYIARYLGRFALFLGALLVANAAVFMLAFNGILSEDYGSESPVNVLDDVAEAYSEDGVPDAVTETLKDNDIWAMHVNEEGQCDWSISLPESVPHSFSLSDVATFSKGYIEEYPVFVRSVGDGLLVLGYPKDSFMKITGNYLPLRAVEALPGFLAIAGIVDLAALVGAYCLSRRKLIASIEPIAASIEGLASNKPVEASLPKELEEIEESLNKAAVTLSNQDKARAEWIQGVSHDIRTPLSMIVGYAQRISCRTNADNAIRQEAAVIQSQGAKIKDLVQDLNLVSQLEYDSKPIAVERVRPAELIRTYSAELLNSGAASNCRISIDVQPDSEHVVIEGDRRMLVRAIDNLAQNSIGHNPAGCSITVELKQERGFAVISIVDDGIGVSAEKARALELAHENADDEAAETELHHGMGLLLVRRIAKAHNGNFKISANEPTGTVASLSIPCESSAANC